MPARDHAALRMEYVPIEELKPDAANPRRIKGAELENLTQSLRKFGFVQPLVARRKDGMVIGGHQRLLAARRLGLKVVPVIYLDVSVEEGRLLNLGLNRISGEWDEQLLAQLLAELRPVEGIDLQLSGFSIEEVERLLKSLDLREKKERLETFDLEAALEAATTAPQAQHSDLFALGDHRLLCGDAGNEHDVARLLNGTKAAMAFTDSPYNVDYGNHGNPRWGRNRPIKNDSLSTEEWEAFCRGWAKTLLGSVDGAIYVCMSCKEWPVVSRILEESDAHWSTTIIWSKDRFTLGRADYQRGYEPIWYGWRGGAKHHWCGDRDQSDVWRIERASVNPLHPTMKPLPLIERAMENSSRVGDNVLDLFLGSGSTLIAAERTGRTCFGMEIDPRYVDVVVRRWEAFTGAKAEKRSRS